MKLKRFLSFLTGHYWAVEFRQEIFDAPEITLDKEYSIPFEQVNLLSGGLDSLIGALDFLKKNPEKKVLSVSHYDSQMHGPKGDRRGLISEIQKLYPEQFAYIPSLQV